VVNNYEKSNSNVTTIIHYLKELSTMKNMKGMKFNTRRKGVFLDFMIFMPFMAKCPLL